MPVDHRGLAALPGLDDGRVAGGQAHALAGLEHVVVRIAAARQPHAAAADNDIAGLVLNANRVAELHRQTPDRSCVKLRIHHQSPGSAAKVPPHYASILTAGQAQIQ
jgi:hypothetical protein